MRMISAVLAQFRRALSGRVLLRSALLRPALRRHGRKVSPRAEELSWG